MHKELPFKEKNKERERGSVIAKSAISSYKNLAHSQSSVTEIILIPHFLVPPKDINLSLHNKWKHYLAPPYYIYVVYILLYFHPARLFLSFFQVIKEDPSWTAK
jgi:hypothetical protein